MRNYLAPIVCMILLFLGLSIWALWEYQYLNFLYNIERPRETAQTIFDALKGSIKAYSLEKKHYKQLTGILKSVAKTSKLQTVILYQNNKPILSTGALPYNLHFLQKKQPKDIFLLSRVIKIQNGKEKKLKLVLVIDTRKYQRLLKKRLWYLKWRIIAIFLLILAVFVIWIVAIRNRKLMEIINTEQTRAKYLEELRLTASGLAHETKNPLGIIRGLAQRIGDNPDTLEENIDMAEQIMEAVDQATCRLDDFMAYAKFGKAKIEPLDVYAIIHKVAQVLQLRFEDKEVLLQVSCDKINIYADQEMLKQLLVNLLLNSLDASKKDTKVLIQMTQNKDLATLCIKDEGKGISAKILPDVFKPYVSDSPNGHGLGLTVVKRIVDLHQWTISLDSKVEKGTIATIANILVVDKK